MKVPPLAASAGRSNADVRRGRVDLGESFRTIAEAMPHLAWTAASDGSVDYFNRRWIDYTGISLEEYRNQTQTLGVVHPAELEETWARWKAALASSTPYEMEYRLRRASDGSYRWFLTRAIPIFGDDDVVVRWIGTATDIDEQRRGRDSLAFIVEAGKVLAASLDVETICNALARVSIGHFADWSFVTLALGNEIETVAIAHHDETLLHHVEAFRNRYPIRPDDPLARAIAQNAPLLVERVTDEQLERGARDEEHLRLLKLLKMHSVMLVPLATPAGKVYGALNLVSAESGRLFEDSDLNVATAVASRAATAIENALLFERERRTSQRLRIAGKAVELLFNFSDIGQALRRVARMIATEIADACAIVRLREGALYVDAISHRDPKANSAVRRLLGKQPLRPDAERELIAQLLQHEPIVRENDDAERMKARAWPHLASEVAKLGAKSTVILPLYAREAYGGLIAYFSDSQFDRERDLTLLREIASRLSIALEREASLQRERHIATTLQQASLPSLIPQPEGLCFDAVYAPAGEQGEVGGDWYDAIDLDDGSVVISVGDVTGCGLQAAAIMSKVRHAMGVIPRHERNPVNILDSAGWFLRKRYPDAIVTAFVAIISPDHRTLTFANAGHPHPILRRDKELIALRSDGLPLGLRTLAAPEPAASVELQDGDMLVLFTDGLIEWDRDVFEGERRLAGAVRSDALLVAAAPAHFIKRACLPAKAPDDVAILTVFLGEPPAWRFQAQDARAAEDARSLFLEFLRGRTDDADFLTRAELVFGELLSNVVRYAPGPVEIALMWNEREAVLHVIDSGKAFDSANELPANILSEFGRGLYIVEQLAKQVSIEHVAGVGNHIATTL